MRKLIGIGFAVGTCAVLGIAPEADAVVVGDPNPCALFAQSASPVEANLSAGSASTSIPIAVPSGPKGMSPALALVYSSSGGPSLYGHGWDLPIGQIRRSVRNGLLTCADIEERHEYVLSIGGSTVEFFVQGSEGLAHVEDSFFKIQRHDGLGSQNYWEVWDQSGTRYVFGRYERWSETGSNTPRTGSSTQHGFVASSCQGSHLTGTLQYTATWELTRIEDPHGNWIDIHYAQSGGVARPTAIEYGGNRTQYNAPRYKIDFEWEVRGAEDYAANAKSGFLRELTHRLASIDVKVADGTGGDLIRRYVLDYEHEVSAAPARLARANFLSRVVLHDENGVALARYDDSPAARDFTYGQVSQFGGVAVGPQVGSKAAQRPEIPDLMVLRMVTAPPTPATLVDPGGHLVRTLIDMNGDGILDMVDTYPVNGGTFAGSPCEQSGLGSADQWDVYLGTPAGFDSSGRSWTIPYSHLMCLMQRNQVPASALNVVETYTTTIDLNGDGIPDFIHATSNQWLVYLGYSTPSGDGGFSPTSQSWGSTPSGGIRRVRSNVSMFGYAGGSATTPTWSTSTATDCSTWLIRRLEIRGASG